MFPGDRTSAVTKRRKLLRVTEVWAVAAGLGGGRRGQTGLVRAPGVVCRASAGLRCLARRPDAGTRSQRLPGSTKTRDKWDIKPMPGRVAGEDQELCETKKRRTKWCVHGQFACLCKYNFHQTLEELIFCCLRDCKTEPLQLNTNQVSPSRPTLHGAGHCGAGSRLDHNTTKKHNMMDQTDTTLAHATTHLPTHSLFVPSGTTISKASAQTDQNNDPLKHGCVPNNNPTQQAPPGAAAE